MSPIDRRALLQSVGLALGALTGTGIAGAGVGAAQGQGAAGRAVARLSLNENPYGPSPAVVTALQQEFAKLCRYTSGAEYEHLLDQIAAKEGLPRDQIILGEILEPLGTHLSQQGGPGGEFIYSDPGYTALIDSAAAVGGRAIGVPLNANLENDLPALAARVSERTRAVFLVNPHNPTGIVADADELKSFARGIARRALLIVDEAYLEFAGGFERRSLAGLVRGGDNVIVFRTFAKAYGLAGLDIGYGLVPRPIAAAMGKLGLDNPHLFNRLAVAAASASLQDRGYLDGVVRAVERERSLWFDLFRDLRLRFTPAAANFVFFETGLPNSEFATALAQQGIAIGRAFPPYDRWARISIGLPQENALARAAVRQLLGKR